MDPTASSTFFLFAVVVGAVVVVVVMVVVVVDVSTCSPRPKTLTCAYLCHTVRGRSAGTAVRVDNRTSIFRVSLTTNSVFLQRRRGKIASCSIRTTPDGTAAVEMVCSPRLEAAECTRDYHRLHARLQLNLAA